MITYQLANFTCPLFALILYSVQCTVDKVKYSIDCSYILVHTARILVFCNRRFMWCHAMYGYIRLWAIATPYYSSSSTITAPHPRNLACRASARLQNFVERMLVYEPERRATAADLLSDMFLLNAVSAPEFRSCLLAVVRPGGTLRSMGRMSNANLALAPGGTLTSTSTMQRKFQFLEWGCFVEKWYCSSAIYLSIHLLTMSMSSYLL